MQKTNEDPLRSGFEAPQRDRASYGINCPPLTSMICPVT
jgi:hypothetical protein